MRLSPRRPGPPGGPFAKTGVAKAHSCAGGPPRGCPWKVLSASPVSPPPQLGMMVACSCWGVRLSLQGCLSVGSRAAGAAGMLSGR